MKHLICNRLGHLLRLRRHPSLDSNSEVMESRALSTTIAGKEERDVTGGYNATVDLSNVSCSIHHPQQQHQHSSLGGRSDDYDDWKYAAHVIDRLCFCICVIYLTIVTVVFYMYAITATL